MDNEVLVAIILGVQAIVVAIIARENNKRKQQAEVRAEESRLSMRLMSASLGLSVETAHAIKRGSTNGEMDSALEEAADARSEYDKFVRGVAATQITG